MQHILWEELGLGKDSEKTVPELTQKDWRRVKVEKKQSEGIADKKRFQKEGWFWDVWCKILLLK